MSVYCGQCASVSILWPESVAGTGWSGVSILWPRAWYTVTRVRAGTGWSGVSILWPVSAWFYRVRAGTGWSGVSVLWPRACVLWPECQSLGTGWSGVSILWPRAWYTVARVSILGLAGLVSVYCGQCQCTVADERFDRHVLSQRGNA